MPLPVSDEEVEILIALLSAVGYDSFEEQSDRLIAFIQKDSYSEESIREIEYVDLCFKNENIDIEELPDKNWNEVWESNYPAVTIADQCHVRAPFHEENKDVDYDIIIKPKMAFGTAHHETTAMMLEYILRDDMNNVRLLDMGCGSGVLAILASMKGASSVVAVDTDSWSYDNTLENCEINNITNIEVIQGGAETLSKLDDFDVIMANINKNILLQDMKYYSASLKRDGVIYFSGYYKDDLQDIINEAKNYGMVYIDNIENPDNYRNWVAAKFIKQL